jgi:hypothetical protein
MRTDYIKFDEDIDREEQERQMEILFNRVSMVTPILFEEKPTLIPFKYDFPIIDPNEQSVFLKECQKHHLFENLPKHYKKKVFVAEKVNFYNLRFLEYLENKKVTIKEFSEKNPKTKLDVFYDFLFSNHMDVGILEL